MPIGEETRFGELTIPAQQDLPPAGNEAISFRPACDQLVPINDGDMVAWGLTMPDTSFQVLAHHPPMSTEAAYGWLDMEGNCKAGGEHVPLIYVDQLPQTDGLTPQTPVDPNSSDIAQGGTAVQTQSTPTGGNGLISIVGGSVVLLAVFALIFWLSRRKPRPQVQGFVGQSQQAPQKTESRVGAWFDGNQD